MAISRNLETPGHASPNIVLVAGNFTVGSAGAVGTTVFKNGSFVKEAGAGEYTFTLDGKGNFMGVRATTSEQGYLVNTTDNKDGTLTLQVVDATLGTAANLSLSAEIYLMGFVKTDNTPFRGNDTRNSAGDLKANDKDLVLVVGRFSDTGGTLPLVDAPGCTVARVGAGHYTVTIDSNATGQDFLFISSSSDSEEDTAVGVAGNVLTILNNIAATNLDDCSFIAVVKNTDLRS